MSAVIPYPDFTPEELKKLPDEDLFGLLESLGGLTVKIVQLAGWLWRELTGRGHDLSRYKNVFMRYAPLIASGAVLPETVVKFQKLQTLLKAVASLPIPDQKKLCAGEPVIVVERTADGYTHRLLPVDDLLAPTVRQVFGDRCIRGEVEQIAYLAAAPVKSKGPKPPKRGKVRADLNARVLVAGKSLIIDPADCVTALADLEQPSSPLGKDAEEITIRLTPEEKGAFRRRAEAAGLSLSEFGRKCFRRLGQI